MSGRKRGGERDGWRGRGGGLGGTEEIEGRKDIDAFMLKKREVEGEREGVSTGWRARESDRERKRGREIDSQRERERENDGERVESWRDKVRERD